MPDPPRINDCAANEEPRERDPPVAEPFEPRWQPASEPTCCGSGCDDCPF